MEPGQATAGAFVKIGAGNAPPVTLNDAVRQMGGTRAAAERLGISQREVQRITKAERGEPGEIRHPSKETQAKITALTQRLGRGNVDRKIRRQGATVHFRGLVTVSPGGRRPDTREKEYTVYLPGEAMRDVVAAAEQGDFDTAGAVLIDRGFDEWGIGQGVEINNVDELDIEIGQP